ncbi:MAG: hypothetical protein QW172_03580 [Candidatus Bathyarchaeia archaeon]
MIEKAAVASEVRRRVSHMYSLVEDFYRRVNDRSLKADEHHSWVEGEFLPSLNLIHREIVGFLDSLGVSVCQPGITGKTLDEIVDYVVTNTMESLGSESERELWARQMLNILRDYHLTVEMLMRNLQRRLD